MIEKSPEAFRTISEVAEELDLPQHVLRFWETRFAQIKPMKRGGGRRYYRPEDTNLLKGIRFLLYGEGYTIKGVQRILKEQGVRHVASVWEEMAEEAEDEPGPAPVAQEVPAQHPQTRQAPIQRAAPSPADNEPDPRVTMEPRIPAPRQQPPQPPAPPMSAAADPASAPVPVAPAPAVASRPGVAASHAGLSPDDVRQLKAALFELIECKRLLDSTTQAAAV